MSGDRADIVAVLPALDCAGTIADVVQGLRLHVGRVVVVSDGSRDDTAEVARRAGAEVEVLPENRGKGYALRRGLEIALAGAPRAIALVDADGQHDPADLPALLSGWRERSLDLVVGCRLASPELIPPVRYWTNYIGSRILSWFTGRELEDSQSGYRVLDAALAGRLRLRSDGYAIETEMLIKAAAEGARIGHARVRTIYNDEGSHFRPFLDTVRISCAAIYFKVFDDS
jgi:glycosyltransferase involved in cell wall biosynthesis